MANVKRFTGVVVSDVQDKTIVVRTDRRMTHPVYKKQYPYNRKYQVHDETNEAQLGDKVSFVETRPISKNKSFKLVKVLERKEGAAEEVVA